MGRFHFMSSLSNWLLKSPWTSNAVIGSTIGFCADVANQGPLRQFTGQPPLRMEDLPPGSAASPMVMEYSHHSYLSHLWPSHLSEYSYTEPTLIDFRRSIIFASYTAVVSTAYFLAVYRQLDRIFPPKYITRRNAMVKGFMSWIAANAMTPFYLTYVVLLNRYFIYHTGRPLDDAGSVQWAVNLSVLVNVAGNHLRHQIFYVWPKIMRYGIIFWGVNWVPMFYSIPPHFRFVYGTCLQVLWSVFMSHVIHDDGGSESGKVMTEKGK